MAGHAGQERGIEPRAQTLFWDGGCRSAPIHKQGGFCPSGLAPNGQLALIRSKVAEQAEAVGKAKDLESARTAFKDLSDSLIAYLQKQKIQAGSYYVAYCPMAKASWIQTDKTIINPYMGKGMLNCGKIKG